MPIYDYECRNCGHRVEVIHGVNANGPSACERCGGPMRKLLTTPSIVFKGSGWAKKDRSTARTAAKSDGSKATEGSGDSQAKSDSAKDGDAGTAARSDGTSDSKAETKSDSTTQSKAPANETKSTGGTRPTD